MAKKIKIFFPNGKDFIETDSENLDSNDLPMGGDQLTWQQQQDKQEL